ncbi:M28 family metallopeptidase [Paenibacillus sp. CAU 1782]
MKTKKMGLITLLMLALCVGAIAGCKPEGQHGPITGTDYKANIDDLTAPAMGGRLTGTAGNEAAAAVIEHHFQLMGLEHFTNGSYAIPYQHQYAVPEEGTLELAVNYRDGSREVLLHGQDYLEQRLPFDYEGAAAITFDEKDAVLAERVLVLDDGSAFTQMDKTVARMVLIREDKLRRYIPGQSAKTPVLHISNEIYQKLRDKEADISEISLSVKVLPRHITADNLVGVIKGKGEGDQRDAIVLSAHFDSVGQMDSLPFAGAVDNATGVTALLQLANHLKGYAQKSPLGPDIIIAAFNGQVSGRQGSKAFVNQLLESKLYDRMYTINLDSVGGKGGGPYYIIGDDNSVELAAELETYMNNHRFPIQRTERGYDSDHLSFQERELIAVTIGQADVPYSRTVQDTKDKVNFTTLKKLVSVLFNFIISSDYIEQAGIMEEKPEPLSDEDRFKEFEALQRAYRDAMNKMKFGQYQVFNDGDTDLWLVKGYENFESIEEAAAAVKGLTIPPQLGGSAFTALSLWIDLPVQDLMVQVERNKVFSYEGEITTELLGDLTLYYGGQENNGIRIRIINNEIIKIDEGFVDSSTMIEQTELENKVYTVREFAESLFVVTEVAIGDSTYSVEVTKGSVQVSRDETGLWPTLIYGWNREDRDSAPQFVHDLKLDELLPALGLK